MKIKGRQRVFNLFYIIYFLSCFFLFYKQSIGEYYSDLLDHIKMGQSGEGYSIVYFSYKVLCNVFGNTYGVAVLLACVCVLTIYITYIFLKKYGAMDNWEAQLYAIICSFAMPIFIPYLYSFHYAGTLSGQAWHNSTYLIMRVLGMAILLLYFKIEETYLVKMNTKELLLFACGLIIINMVKPNFVFVFAPMMALNLLIDLLFKNGKFQEKFRNIFIFGCCVLPSLTILLIQNKILFGEDTGSKLAFTFGEVFFELGDPVLKVILSITFPLFILLINRKDLKRDKIYRSVWTMWVIAFLEYFFLSETGIRRMHGNFAWGVMFCTFLLFIVSVCKFANGIGIITKSKMYVVHKFHYIMSGIVLLLHCIAGVIYYLSLLRGGNYKY